MLEIVAPPQQALTLAISIGFIGFFLGLPVSGFIAQQTSLQTVFAIIVAIGLFITFLNPFIRLDVSN